MHEVDREIFPVSQCIILQNFTSFRQIVQQYFANSFVQVCARVYVYENKHARCTTQIGKHTQYFNVLSYQISSHSVERLSSTCFQIHFWEVKNWYARCMTKIGKHSRYLNVSSYNISCHSVQQIRSIWEIHFSVSDRFTYRQEQIQDVRRSPSMHVKYKAS